MRLNVQYANRICPRESRLMLELTVGELMNCDWTCCGPNVCVSDGSCSTGNRSRRPAVTDARRRSGLRLSYARPYDCAD